MIMSMAPSTPKQLTGPVTTTRQSRAQCSRLVDGLDGARHRRVHRLHWQALSPMVKNPAAQ